MNPLRVFSDRAFVCLLAVISISLTGVMPAAAAPPAVDARGNIVDPSAATDSPALATGPAGSAAFRLKVGDVYATASFKADIVQIGRRGVVVASLQIPGYPDGFKGTAFGPDGRLYVVAVVDSGYEVLVLEDDGSVVKRYQGQDYVFGNLSYGKIAVARDGTVYVGGQNVLRRFRKHSTTGDVIFVENQIYDVDIMPNGNLVVASAYDLYELSSSGSVVRAIAPQQILTDIRGLLYHPESNDLFVTMLGNSGNAYSMMRIDVATGELERTQLFSYADDLTLTAEGSLLVGSRFNAPRMFSLDLIPQGDLASDDRMFVTRMPEPLHRFADGFE